MISKIVHIWLKITDAFNEEIHQQIEDRIIKEDKKRIPNPDDIQKRQERIDEMRKFYYPRMMNSSNLILAFLSIVVAILSLVIATFALFTSK